ncbi:MAG: Rieske (2Fe-2S) protein [candidate division Zixibacteria bacterium]|nr:Rieske (2Fe-2S) protein [candidate division Zixibacteria bacterium]
MSEKSNSINKERRSFLGKLAFGVISLGIFGQGWTYMRSLIPNILYEPAKKFKVGLPNELPEGISFIESQRVFVIKDGNHFSCLSAKCTHLGCTVKHAPLAHEETIELRGQEVTVDHEFVCPCHGSKFRQDGSPYSGPAPSALPWHKLEVAPDDGQLVVDISKKVNNDFRLTV